MVLEVKTTKNSKLPKMSENCFELVGKGGWPPISIWITYSLSFLSNNCDMFFIIKYFSLRVFYVCVCRYLVQQYTTHSVLAIVWPLQVYVQNWHAFTPFENNYISQLHPLTFILRIPTPRSVIPSPPLHSNTLNR